MNTLQAKLDAKMKKEEAVVFFDSNVAEWKRGYVDSGIEVRVLEANAATGALTIYRMLATGNLNSGNTEDN